MRKLIFLVLLGFSSLFISFKNIRDKKAIITLYKHNNYKTKRFILKEKKDFQSNIKVLVVIRSMEGY